MEKVDWITTWYEFGGEMQISSARLQALPLFRNGIPLELYIHHSSEAKKRRVVIVMLPYVQSATEFYNLINRHIYETRPLDENSNMRKFIDAKCRCLLGSYSLSTHRPRHTVKVNVYSIDSDGQKDSINKVYAHDYMNNQKAGSKLEVIVDGVNRKKMLLTPIVKCEDDINHIDFVKTIAKREMSKLLPANFLSEIQTTSE